MTATDAPTPDEGSGSDPVDELDLETRRDFLQLLAMVPDCLPELATETGETETAMVRYALQVIALELAKVAIEHEVGTKEDLAAVTYAAQYTGGLVGGLIGVPSGAEDHPFPESFDIGARERARFLGDRSGVRAAQQRINLSQSRDEAS